MCCVICGNGLKYVDVVEANYIKYKGKIRSVHKKCKEEYERKIEVLK